MPDRLLCADCRQGPGSGRRPCPQV